MDRFDLLLLGELLKDPKMSFVTIAKKFDTSPYTVRRRYEKMKKEGMIQKCIVSIDLTKLGYQGKVFLMVTVSPKKDKAETITALKRIRNIIAITEIVGDFDILANAPVADLNDIRALTNEAKRAPHVERVEIALISDTAYPINPSFGKLLSQKSYDIATLKKVQTKSKKIGRKLPKIIS